MIQQHPSEFNSYQDRQNQAGIEYKSKNSSGNYGDNSEGNSLQVQTNSNSKEVKQEKPNKPPSLTDIVRNTFVRKANFVYVHEESERIDSKSFLFKCLFLYLIEYLLIFAFQLVSYLAIYNEWRNTSWIIGVVLAIVYVPVCLIICYLQHKRERFILYFMKFIEFGIHFVFLGWAVAYVDFSFMALSYVIIVNIILLYVFVG